MVGVILYFFLFDHVLKSACVFFGVFLFLHQGQISVDAILTMTYIISPGGDSHMDYDPDEEEEEGEGEVKGEEENNEEDTGDATSTGQDDGNDDDQTAVSCDIRTDADAAGTGADAGAGANADADAGTSVGVVAVDAREPSKGQNRSRSGSACSTGSRSGSMKEVRLICTNRQRHILGVPPPALGSITIALDDASNGEESGGKEKEPV